MDSNHGHLNSHEACIKEDMGKRNLIQIIIHHKNKYMMVTILLQDQFINLLGSLLQNARLKS